MAIVTTDDRHYKAIADVVRDRGGDAVVEVFEKDTFTSGEMADAVGVACDANYDEGVGVGYEDGFTTGVEEGFSEGYSTGHAEGYEEGHPEGYVEGYDAGITEGAEICAAKHFVHTFVGDGSTTATMNIPFEPDKLILFNLDPLVQTRAKEIALFVADLSAFGRYAAVVALGSGTALSNAVYTTKSVLTRYSRQPDGTVTLQNVGLNATDIGVFTAGQTFVLVAIKHIEQTDKERITDFVNGLAGSGTATLNQAKVNAAFTDAEWSALIATKPNWTFAFI